MAAERGQAIFEFIVFLPFLLFMFVIMTTIGNSINASINQQKVTRRYFYFLLKGNSTAPNRGILEKWEGDGLTYAGMSYVGFWERRLGGEPVAPCFKLNTLFSGGMSETCENPSSGSKSRFVRTFTTYGICGETYGIDGGGFFKNYHNSYHLVNRVGSGGSCVLQ